MKDNWISVENKLPDCDDYGNSNEVIMSVEFKKMRYTSIGRLVSNRWYWVEDKNILTNEFKATHWMPLPEPPKS